MNHKHRAVPDLLRDLSRTVSQVVPEQVRDYVGIRGHA